MKRYCVRSTTLATLQRLRFLQTRIDARIIKTGFDTNTYRSNFIVEELLRKGQVFAARKVFDEMPQKNMVSTNTMISGYVKSGDLSRARELFDAIVDRTVVTWTILMGWYSGNNQFDEAFKLFREMCRSCTLPDHVTFATLLPGCNDAVPENVMGRQVHCQAIVATADSIPHVGNSLVDMYAKCEMFEEREFIFKRLSQQSVVSWTALISGYVQKGLHEAGLKFFTKMRGANLRADQSTFATVLKASATFASLLLGKQLHAFIIRSGNSDNVFSGSGLVDMYVKSGSIKDAVQVFKEMPDRNAVSWNALISAHAHNGDGEAAIGAFTDMIH
ncbi:unnamed protein product [Arabis nemorensis]|uniref:Pentacotripeptide-repeat region of PRORP domain-containing protein n=1 Tax=Arabis nemorensis TaxID=586526 RepID=A0A565C6X6_9BRAS|nr:unnamed protein product [Arabis nemorensis]